MYLLVEFDKFIESHHNIYPKLLTMTMAMNLQFVNLLQLPFQAFGPISSIFLDFKKHNIAIFITHQLSKISLPLSQVRSHCSIPPKPAVFAD